MASNDSKSNTLADTSKIREPERRFINNRWICLTHDKSFLEYINGEWKTCSDNYDSLLQSWENALVAHPNFTSQETLDYSKHSKDNESLKCVVDGVQMVWNTLSQQWLPDVEVNEDFLAVYNANYGVAYDYSHMVGSSTEKQLTKEEKKPLTKEEKKQKKLELDKLQSTQGWVDIDNDKNTSVYVSNLPCNITEEEFIKLMSKCGVIMKDPRSNKPKIKLYRTVDGDLKGDGTCCYIKMESVEIALQILDGWDLDGHKIHVERAKFELKGEYDPKKKKRKLTAAQKKRFFETQNKIFEWKPEKPRNYRPISDCTVVLKNLFTLDEIDENTAKIFDLKNEIKTLCERYGTVKKVVLYDSNPEGVITVTFDNVEYSDIAVKMLDRILFNGKLISATLWDGKTKYFCEETEEERQKRDQAWQRFLGVEENENN